MEKHNKRGELMKSIFQKLCLAACILYFTAAAFAQENPPSQHSDQEFEGFNLEGYTDDGEKSWDVEGDSADIKGSEIELTNVNANSYGESVMNVVAKTGKINQVTGNMALEQDVVITNKDGSQLTTDSLNWNRNQDLVTTNDPVMINNERLLVTGKGLEAKPSQKKTQINENVRALVETETVEDSKIVTITSVGPMTIDQGKLMARFEDDVVAEQEDQTLKADVLEIYFEKDMSSILEMICYGNVEVIRGENQTFAQKAIYNAKTKKLVLSGRPKLILNTEGDDVFTTTGN